MHIDDFDNKNRFFSNTIKNQQAELEAELELQNQAVTTLQAVLAVYASDPSYSLAVLAALTITRIKELCDPYCDLLNEHARIVDQFYDVVYRNPNGNFLSSTEIRDFSNIGRNEIVTQMLEIYQLRNEIKILHKELCKIEQIGEMLLPKIHPNTSGTNKYADLADKLYNACFKTSCEMSHYFYDELGGHGDDFKLACLVIKNNEDIKNQLLDSIDDNKTKNAFLNLLNKYRGTDDEPDIGKLNEDSLDENHENQSFSSTQP